MNLDKFFQDISKKEFTDAELILSDHDESISIHIHKCVLAFMSDYFYKLFLFGIEKNQTQIIVNVSNARIAYDIILSFYGKKVNYDNSKYLLETIKIRNFFCLDVDVSLLYNLNVSSKDFNLLLEIMDLFDITNNTKLLKVIKKNIPMDYDLQNLSFDFIKLLSVTNDYKIVSGNNNGIIKIWDADNGHLINTLEDHSGSVNCVAFSFNNLKIVSGSFDDSIKIWDATSGNLINTLYGNTWEHSSQYNLPFKGQGHSNLVFSVAFSPNNLKIVSGGCDNSIKIWDADNGILINTLYGHSDTIHSVAFSPNNFKIVSGSNDNSIKIWDADGGNLINTLHGHSRIVRCVAFSPDNLKIVSGSDDKSIKIWDADNGLLINTLNGHTNSVNSVAFSPNNLNIVSGSNDKSIKIWDAESGLSINTLNDHASVLCVALSFDSYGDINKKLIDYLNKSL